MREPLCSIQDSSEAEQSISAMFSSRVTALQHTMEHVSVANITKYIASSCETNFLHLKTKHLSKASLPLHLYALWIGPAN